MSRAGYETLSHTNSHNVGSSLVDADADVDVDVDVDQPSEGLAGSQVTPGKSISLFSCF